MKWHQKPNSNQNLSDLSRLAATLNQRQVVNFGLATDTPVPADYDGDGRAAAAVYQNGT